MSATDRIRDRAKSAREAESMIGIDPIVDMEAGDVEALCDLADAARRRRAIDTCEWCYDGDCTGTGTGICPCDHACRDAEYQADVAIDQALARLDGEDGDG